MKVLVLGGTGATGKLLIKELLNRGIKVVTIIRTLENISDEIISNPNITIVVESVSDITPEASKEFSKDCDVIVSCLGHNLTFKGIYGKPTKLVTNVTKIFCEGIISSGNITKFILMNTTGNRNKEIDEKISLGEKLVIGLIRLLLPPQRDNENAANYLQNKFGKDNKYIKWVAVRPDTLINNNSVTDYEIFISPTRSAIFNPGKTSRINVAHFMSELITNSSSWENWNGKMPVIYNKEI